jgi:hypothetical protein
MKKTAIQVSMLPKDLTELSGTQLIDILEIYEKPHQRATELIMHAKSYCHDNHVSPKEFGAFIGRVTQTLITIGMSRGWDKGKEEAKRYE